LDIPGIQTPSVQPASAARLHDDAVVLGVSAGGRHRAYLLAAFDGIRWHIVNDQLAGVPITVTYCDRTGCVKVFTGPPGAPLDVALGGFVGSFDRGSLLLRVGSVLYRQDSGQALAPGEAPFPYAPVEFVRTTWKDWCGRHPDTDVYVGQLPVDATETPDP
jgi:hypothetical protein